MTRPIRILILIAFLAFLSDGFMEQQTPQANHLFDSLFTLLLLAAIWFHLTRRSKERPGKRVERTSHPASPMAGHSEPSKARVAPVPPAPSQHAVERPPPTLGGLRVIYHQTPWSVVERGQVLGKFRDTLISAWVRTSDQRTADYVGIQVLSYPDKCQCIEIPEKSEFILPPGMVYTIRSS